MQRMTIDVRYESDIAELSEQHIRDLFDAAARTVTIPQDFEWSVAFVDDSVIQQLNNTHRGKDKPTDVLSFPYDETHGEIVISVDRVREQAAEYGNTVHEEASWMVVHGILHVLGWDHERSEQEHAEQRELEVTILNLCGIKCAR